METNKLFRVDYDQDHENFSTYIVASSLKRCIAFLDRLNALQGLKHISLVAKDRVHIYHE